ncbi:hypothetical protein [Azospirillum baldaniorum]|uniref:hypothetical protein n=1 Tax=Azospirillum baldaniorum TaxID=1064539 RepID=UPI001FCC01EE|nr:hypothetical protein [Azospirillum baldaniorum]
MSATTAPTGPVSIGGSRSSSANPASSTRRPPPMAASIACCTSARVRAVRSRAAASFSRRSSSPLAGAARYASASRRESRNSAVAARSAAVTRVAGSAPLLDATAASRAGSVRDSTSGGSPAWSVRRAARVSGLGSFRLRSRGAGPPAIASATRKKSGSPPGCSRSIWKARSSPAGAAPASVGIPPPIRPARRRQNSSTRCQ